MSTINPTDPTSNNLDSFSDPNALSADTLLIYCRSQLNSFDNDIKGFLSQQRTNLARKKALGDIENMMKKYANVPNGKEQWKDYDDTWARAIDSLSPGDPMRTQLQDKWKELFERQGNFTKEEWTGITGDIHSMIEDVNGNAEINMIQLQSVMSQRQTVVQLTTNLMTKFDEGTKSVISNIGR